MLVQAARQLEFALGQTARPLTISQECLRLREQRVGVDAVKDAVERGLQREIEAVKVTNLQLDFSSSS